MNISLKLGGAFIGLMVGVGFSSGREILMFFTSFGYEGLIGALVALFLFCFLLKNIFLIGNQLSGNSHKEAIEHICGRFAGKFVDVFLTFGLFGGMTVMLAGASSSFEQQLGLPHYLGGLLVGIATVITVCLGLKNVIRLMSSVTPVIILFVLIIGVYSFSSIDLSFDKLESLANQQTKAASNWLLSSLLYVSYNIAGTCAVVLVLGGSSSDSKAVGKSGIIGGVGIGVLILMMTLILMAKVDVIQGKPIPTLFLSSQISPWFGYLMLGFLMLKLYCTTVGLTYGLSARLHAYGIPFKFAVLVFVSLSYVGSLFGFVKLVKFVYPAQGYMGFVLMVCILIYWIKNLRNKPAL